MTGGAELGSGSPYHGVIGEAEQRESQEDSHHDVEHWLKESSHGNPRNLEKTLSLHDCVAIVCKDKQNQ